MAQFCTRCGTHLGDDMRFCPACGAAAGMPPTVTMPQAPALVTPAVPPMVAPYAVAPAVAPAKSSGHPILKAVLAVLGIMFLLAVICVGAGVYYYYHHIKPTVNAIESAVRSYPGVEQAPAQPAPPGSGASSPSGGGSSPGGAPGSGADNAYHSPFDLAQQVVQMEKEAGLDHPAGPTAPAIPDPKFPALSPGDSSVYAGKLTFQPGMTITGSVTDAEHGDYEVIDSIKEISPEGVNSTISAEMPGKTPGATPAAQPSAQTVTVEHRDSLQDLMHATGYMPFFGEGFPLSIPGATMVVYSQDIYRGLKSGSGADISQPVDSPASRIQMMMIAAGSNAPMGINVTGAPPAGEIWSKLNKETCHATRVGAGDAAFPVLLNGRRTTLPAIRNACKPNTQVSGYVLDDDQLPLLLWAQSGQVTQINFPMRSLVGSGGGGGGGGGSRGSARGGGGGGGGGQGIEQALKKEGHVDVYGIYFDFASDKLRPESGPVLAEIASALKNNPTWKLHVNGHTDNIGGDAYNLDLSNRRAAAVKRALVTHYQIDPARLDPQGFGLTQPKESNATPAGRARNRRVELVRE